MRQMTGVGGKVIGVIGSDGGGRENLANVNQLINNINKKIKANGGTEVASIAALNAPLTADAYYGEVRTAGNGELIFRTTGDNNSFLDTTYIERVTTGVGTGEINPGKAMIGDEGSSSYGNDALSAGGNTTLYNNLYNAVTAAPVKQTPAAGNTGAAGQSQILALSTDSKFVATPVINGLVNQYTGNNEALFSAEGFRSLHGNADLGNMTFEGMQGKDNIALLTNSSSQEGSLLKLKMIYLF
jgi:hypothetical protein